MQKIKSLIIILAIIIILIIIAMVVISNQNTNKNNAKTPNDIIENDTNINEENKPDAPDERVTAKNVTRLNNTNMFFSIEKCMYNYFIYLRAGNSKAIYEIIEEDYKDSNGINEQNVLEELRKDIIYDGKYNINEIYVREDNHKPIYFIYGTLRNDVARTPYYLIMKQDKANIAFSLRPITKDEYEMYTQGVAKETFEDDIKLKKYNKIMNIALTDEEVAKKYFNSYIQNARYDTQEAYNSLDEEYRNARFGNYQNFIEYLSEETKAKQIENFDRNNIKGQEDFATEEEYKEYIDTLNQASIKKYYKHVEDGKEYYICLDAYDNFYIFEISSVMNYKLYLDSYTIDTPYFLSQYTDEETTTEEKGQINVEKIFEAINNKDYRYVYNKIDNNVRNELFGTYENFVNYIRKNLFNMNNIEFDESLEEDNICTEKLIVTDKTAKDIKQILMTIVLELDNENSYIITDIQFK